MSASKGFTTITQRLKEPLSVTHPELAKQWHPTENGDLTPDDVSAGSGTKAWWWCPEGPDHVWQTRIYHRAKSGSGCPFCQGLRASVTNSLASLYPELAKQWHPTKNGNLTPEDVVAASGKKAWWLCLEGPDHEWPAVIGERTSSRRPTGCPYCAKKKVSVTNSLATLFPEVAAEWHPTKNGDRTPDQVVAGSNKIFWWQCSKEPTHEWPAKVMNRTFHPQPTGCRYCSNKEVSKSNSLAALYPELATQWHPTKNRPLTPEQVVSGSNKRVWWKCPEGPDHEWPEQIIKRTSRGYNCPFCANKRVSITNSLAARFPDIAAQWHPTKNGDRTPDQVVAGTHDVYWWQCPENPNHQWPASLDKRTGAGRGCPVCNYGWTIVAIRGFVDSLKDHLTAFTPAELYKLFQQNGLLQASGRGKTFVKALATGRFPLEEIEKFVEGQPSIVDDFVGDPDQTLEAQEINGTGSLSEDSDVSKKIVDEVAEGDGLGLPAVETKEALAALDHAIVSSADEEAVEFLLASAVDKIWKHAFYDEEAAVAQADNFSGGEYAERVRKRFLDEYRQAKELRIPQGYAFEVEGELTPPDLMQRVVATRVQTKKRVGNWSGTGAGKTLSAILATRLVGSGLTVICCPNSIVGDLRRGWRSEIRKTFPDSLVETKSFEPDWTAISERDTDLGAATRCDPPRYLILNYEAFQQPDSAQRVRALVERERIDFIIVDEIHYSKQRSVENISRRRQLVTALTTLAAERNPDLHVLGMSATPVINNLQEGKSLVELVTGVAHDDLGTRATVPNCMDLHQRLVTLGIRKMPEYDRNYYELSVEVNCEEYVDEIRELGRAGTPLALEQILTRARLPIIRKHVKPKTLIYTHYVKGIDRLLWNGLVEDDWKVGFYTGEDKSGLEGFLYGDVDVLIGSSAIGTGVDGLQQVCNRLIVNVLPWTAAEFEQLKGRIYRRGQPRDVTMVMPLTFAEVGGKRWSWCDSKMQRLRFKKSIADAAVDGVVPEGHLRSPEQAYQDAMAWLKRLEAGETQVITRPKIVVPLPDTDPADVGRRQRRYGDLPKMNHTWNTRRSDTTHERLQANPEEWAQYHTLYKEDRKEWAVVPYEEMIRWCEKRSGYVIGDFGCGEAKLAEAVSDRHTVHSFDHVAVNDNVVACDMAHVPLDDEDLDVAIFSLSLMGTNFTDYIKEAYRTLKLDGHLHIIEATSRFTDRERFTEGLKRLGFGNISIEDRWKFTHISALKTDLRPQEDVKIRF